MREGEEGSAGAGCLLWKRLVVLVHDVIERKQQLTEHFAMRSKVRAGLEAGDAIAGVAAVTVEAILRAVALIRHAKDESEDS